MSYVDDHNEFHFDEGKLVNVHSPDLCAGRACVIHDPSDHHMRDWPLHWRPGYEPFTIKPSHFERICPHGIGHPDPDDMVFHVENGDAYIGVHGCDGCCGDTSGI